MDSGIGSFFKLLEVGFSPYLCFIPILRVFPCFGWFKAVRGRLIGPKNMGPNCLKLLKPICEISGREGLLRTDLGSLVIKLLNKLHVDCIRPGMGHMIGPKTWDQNCGIVLEY